MSDKKEYEYVSSYDGEKWTAGWKPSDDSEIEKINASLSQMAKQSDLDKTNENIANIGTVSTASVKNRLRNSARRQYCKAMSKYTLPSAFTWTDTPIQIFSDGINFITPFDVSNYKLTGGITYYVDSDNGADTNAGTSTSVPFKTVTKAYTTCASGDTINIISAAGSILDRGKWLSGTNIEKSVNIIANNPVTVFCGDVLTYTKTDTYNYVYGAARTNVGKVVDINYDKPILYTNVANISACDGLAGSWYSDGTTLYVHTLDNSIPNSKILNILNIATAMVESLCTSRNVKIYLENLTIYGGSAGVVTVANNTSYPYPEFYAKNCKFLHPTLVTGQNVVNMIGVKYAFLQNCEAAFGKADGFNYHAANGGITKFIEVNCIGHDNGVNAGLASDNTFNGSTCHDGIKGIRVNCVYYNNVGANVADVMVGTQTLNFGCLSYDSASPSDTNNSFSAQQSGAEMWMIGCQAFGCTWDIYGMTNTTVHLWNTEYDTIQGGGTRDIINAE
jgi:hypothetical protein